MNNDKADKIIKTFLKSLLNRYQNNLETSMETVISSLIMFIYCITNVIKQMQIVVDHI